MTDIAAGFWPCKVLDGRYGANDKNAPVVRINVEISEGPGKGQRHTYEEVVDNKQAPYIARTCKAVGWRGGTLATIERDVADWISKTGGESTVEIKHIEVKRGKKFEKWLEGGQVGPAPVWVKAGSIGRGRAPLKEAKKEDLQDADEMMRRAMADDGASEPTGGGGGGYDDAPPPGDEDLPFVSLSLAADRDPIRKVRTW